MEVSFARTSVIDVAGGVLLLLLEAIHITVYLAFALTPSYPGGLFLLNVASAVVLAFGVFRGIRTAWHAGAAVALLTFLAFVATRTVGLPEFHLTDWAVVVGIVPLGPLSFADELLIVIAYGVTIRRRYDPRHRQRD
jgi:hypothetical protein